MTPEEIVAEVYKQCALRGRIDLIPAVVHKLADALRTLGDQCDALVKKEIDKKKKSKKQS